jgi:WW domain-containing oxidoreductase
MAHSIPFGSRSTADHVLAGIDLSRKQVLITGCNSGVAIEVMKAFSANGAHLIGMARTLADAELACRAVGRSVTPLGCDPTDLASVDAAVESVRALAAPLDAVIFYSFEMQGFADHIARFVLVNRLAEALRDRTGRIAIASNDASMPEARGENLLPENLSDDKIYELYAVHGQAKLPTALFAKELSRRLQARGVIVNTFHSGTAENRNPHEARNAGHRMIQSLIRPFTKSPAQRAATPTLLAASPLVAGISGEYWSNCQISQVNPQFLDAGLAQRVWEVSAQFAAMAAGRGGLRQVAWFGGDSR